MTGLLFTIATVVGVLLILMAAVIPKTSSLSRFELDRRKNGGEPTTDLDELRNRLYGDIVSVLRVMQAILLVIFVLVIVAALGWVVGSLIAVVVALEYGAFARLPVVQRACQKLYERYELTILRLFDKYRHITRWVKMALPKADEPHIDSKAELAHIIASSRGVLSDDEKGYLSHVITFDEQLVGEVMTPRSVVETVKKNEMLGPLVLDDLHKTGYSRFPVIDGDIDHVVGVLYLRDLLRLDTSRRHTAMAETAMSKNVFYIHQDQTLAHALAAFLKTHHHMFIVVNEFRETVGILTLEDTIEVLLGKKIIDEFDSHDDLRVVAERNPRKNNTTI